MAAQLKYWFRLQAGDRERLAGYLDAGDFAALLTLLNTRRVGTGPLSMCCDLEAIYTQTAEYLKTPEP